MIKEERKGAIAVVTIDRASRRNALDSVTIGELRSRFAGLNADAAVSAIVLGGTPPGFCAGSDLKELATLTKDGMAGHEADTAAFAS